MRYDVHRVNVTYVNYSDTRLRMFWVVHGCVPRRRKRLRRLSTPTHSKMPKFATLDALEKHLATRYANSQLNE